MKIQELFENNNDDLYVQLFKSSFFRNQYEEKFEKARLNVEQKSFMSGLMQIKDINFLFHGSDNEAFDSPIGKLKFMMRTRPLDTIRIVHHWVNKKATEKFGLPIRNLMFTTPSQHIAKTYASELQVIFPISDDYKLFHHPDIVDFTRHYGLLGAYPDFFENFVSALYSTLPKYNYSATTLTLNEDESLKAKFFRANEWDDITSMGEYVFRQLEQDDPDVSRKDKDKIVEIVEKVYLKKVNEIADDYLSGLKEGKKISTMHEIIMYSEEFIYLNLDQMDNFRTKLLEKYVEFKNENK